MASTVASPRPATHNGQHAEAVPSAKRMDIADKSTYWLVLSSIYLTFGFLFYYPFKAKIFDQDASMPSQTKEQFDGSVIDSFPGLDASWVILGVMEGLVVAALIVSLIRREFLPTRRKPWLFGAFGISFLTFAVLIFGERMTSEHEAVANLIGYFAATAIAFILVMLMPPYRSAHWLTGFGGRDT